MTIIFNNFIVFHASLSLSLPARGWTQIIYSLLPFPRQSFLVLLPREMTGGKEVAYASPSNYAIRKISTRRGSIASRGKVWLLPLLLLLLFSPTPPPPSSPVSSPASSTRQTLLLIYSLRVYFAIITFSRLAYRCTSSLINGHESCAKKNETWRKLPAACSRMYLRRRTSCFISMFPVKYRHASSLLNLLMSHYCWQWTSFLTKQSFALYTQYYSSIRFSFKF